MSLLNQKLLDLSARRIRRLMVFMPPRSGKSMFLDQYFPGWYLGTFPDHRIILASYESNFAASWGGKVRDLVDEYGSLWGIRVRADSAARDAWNLERPYVGGMMTAGVGGPIMGRGGDLIIIDDPVKNQQEAESATYRERAWDWYRSTLYTRLEPGGVIILIMTRWNMEDLAGKLLYEMRDGGEQWDILNLPAIAEEENDALGRQIGDPLWPDRFDREQLEIMKQTMGPYWWAALYQQRPAPMEGGLFKQAWFRYYRIEADGDVYSLSTPEGPQYVATRDCWRFSVVDLAASTKETADYSVIATYDVTPNRDLLLLDVVRGHFDASQVDEIRKVYERWRPGYIAVETRGFQLTVMQALVREGLPLRELDADRDKVSRALSASTRYSTGSYYHPHQASWLHDWENEHLLFPKGAHDDQVDCSGYAAIELTKDSAQTMIEHAKARLAAREAWMRQQMAEEALPNEDWY